ncbi:hypothetical protein V8E55_003137 [Tylopilus felleus]
MPLARWLLPHVHHCLTSMLPACCLKYPGPCVLRVSKTIVTFSQSQLPPVANPPDSTIISTTYRYGSDLAQTVLPPVQAVVGAIPIAGTIIKGAIEGILSTLQLLDVIQPYSRRYIQNKQDFESLRWRLVRLHHHMANAQPARTIYEESRRRELLSALETAKSKLENIEKRIPVAPSVSQEIAGCIAAINDHLLEYTVFAVMDGQNDMIEMKNMMAQNHATQIQTWENLRTTFGTGQRPGGIGPSGHVILIDATGQRHRMLLEQCQSLDQLELMLRASLSQCEAQAAEAQRWYIDRKQYEFVVDDGTSMIRLTRDSDFWSEVESGAKIVMRVIIEEVVDATVTLSYECPCGSRYTIDVSIGDVAAALQHDCAITCGCGRRFQITRANTSVDGRDSQEGDTTQWKKTKALIRNFLAKQLLTSTMKPVAVSVYKYAWIYWRLTFLVSCLSRFRSLRADHPYTVSFQELLLTSDSLRVNVLNSPRIKLDISKTTLVCAVYCTDKGCFADGWVLPNSMSYIGNSHDQQAPDDDSDSELLNVFGSESDTKLELNDGSELDDDSGLNDSAMLHHIHNE